MFMVSMENPGPYGLAGMATHSSLVWQHGEFLVDVPYFPFFLKCKQFLEGFVVVSFFFFTLNLSSLLEANPSHAGMTEGEREGVRDGGQKATHQPTIKLKPL